MVVGLVRPPGAVANSGAADACLELRHHLADREAGRSLRRRELDEGSHHLANEALPTDPLDPRIFDVDGDGNPGVTSKVKVSEDLEGEIYIARREIFAYDLTQESPDRLVGHITDRSEQLVFGASDPMFLVAAQWKQIDDRTRNPVIWQRVDANWD